MVNARSGVPRGYQAVMPYLRVRDAASAIKFYKKVFGAEERFRLKMGGKVGHAELSIGGAVVMISDEFPEANAVGPKALKGTSVVMAVYVDDVDKLVAKAVKAGAKICRPVSDQFYGDRTGQIEDPFGHIWSIQTRLEKVNPKDMQKRLNAMLRAEASAMVAKRRGAVKAAKAPKAGIASSSKAAAAKRDAGKATATKSGAKRTASKPVGAKPPRRAAATKTAAGGSEKRTPAAKSAKAPAAKTGRRAKKAVTKA